MYCQECGTPLVGRRADARYCGGACRSAASRRRRETRAKAHRTLSERQSLTGTLQSAADNLQLLPADVAAVQLAHKYAHMIDQSSELDVLDKLGPKLLQVLDALGATPRGRGTARQRHPAEPEKQPGQESTPRPPTRLDQMRAARAGRQ